LLARLDASRDLDLLLAGEERRASDAREVWLEVCRLRHATYLERAARSLSSSSSFDLAARSLLKADSMA
jgi:hypothetical protein